MTKSIPYHEDTAYSRAVTAANLAGYKELPYRSSDGYTAVLDAFKKEALDFVPCPDGKDPYEEGWGHLKGLIDRIFPLQLVGDCLRTMSRSAHPFHESYLWGASEEDEGDEVPNLVPLVRFRTLHHYGHYALFKPSVAEVLAQIPFEYVTKTDFFYLEGPDTADDLNKELLALDAGFHVAMCTLYSEPSKCRNS